MGAKTIPAKIKGQSFTITYDEKEEEFIKSFCNCVIVNNILVEKHRKKKKGNRNVSKIRE